MSVTDEWELVTLMNLYDENRFYEFTRCAKND